MNQTEIETLRRKTQDRFMTFKQNVDNDNILLKEHIKQELLKNYYLLHALNNSELEEKMLEESVVDENGTIVELSGADEYFGINILPYFIISPTQSHCAAYVCFDVVSHEQSGNQVMKIVDIVFHILCEEQIIIDSDSGIARHDLLASLIQDQFNYMSIGSQKIHLISDEPSTVDKEYACRTLVFRQITDNNLVKSVGKIPRFSNKVGALSLA